MRTRLIHMMDPVCFEDLDDTALDRLAYGVVRLSPEGRIERYNLAEASQANMQRWRVLGRDFFRDVLGVDGQYLASLVASLAPGTRARLQHTFARYRHATPVTIDIARGERATYLCFHAAT